MMRLMILLPEHQAKGKYSMQYKRKTDRKGPIEASPKQKAARTRNWDLCLLKGAIYTLIRLCRDYQVLVGNLESIQFQITERIDKKARNEGVNIPRELPSEGSIRN